MINHLPIFLLVATLVIPTVHSITIAGDQVDIGLKATESQQQLSDTAKSSSALPAPKQNNFWYSVTESETVLIFVHGIFSDSRDCWLYEKDGVKQYWPELIRTDPRSDFSSLAIYLAGYYTAMDSGEYGIRNAADEVLAALKRPDEQGRQPVMTKKNLIFIGHSTGGVVIRRMLESNPQEFIDKRVGMVLIASPSYGSHIADYLDPLATLYNQRLGQELQWRSWNLEDLDDRFKNLLNQHRIPWLEGIEAYENHFIVHNKWMPFFTRTYVVTKESAGRYFGAPVMLRDTDHFSTVKPNTRKHPGYELVYDFYRDKFAQLKVGYATTGKTGIYLKQAESNAAQDKNAMLLPAVLVELVENSSLNEDVRYVSNKVHRNLAELLSNSGHSVSAPPLSVSFSADSSAISNRIVLKTDHHGDNLMIHAALTTADGIIVSTTEMTGPLSELKEIYKVIPEAIIFGLDVNPQTLKKKNTAKPSTKNVDAYAHYLYARRKYSTGDAKSTEAALRKAISLDNRFALASWSLGTLLTQQGRAAEGHEFREEASRIDPDHPKITFASPSQQSHPVPSLLSAILASEPHQLETGFVFRKASSKEYGVEMRTWTVDPSLFDIELMEQKSPHGSSIGEFLEDADVILALNGGFFEIDFSQRISPAGVLVVNGAIRKASPNRQSGAFVRHSGGIKIIWALDLEPLTKYSFALQTGPILVEGRGKLGIATNDYDRLNRAAVCSRGNQIIFVTLHGSHGNGLSLYEFAELLVAREIDGGLECDLAINLDGGPSTQVGMNLGAIREQVDGLWKIHNVITVRRK